ncbi:hypothetical protein Q0812_12655 [Brevundimonas sp. 2R-24]|uniref:Lipoprotein n=1 Tax=Peiella sedimenti TaxID=3061083 RepID=A0ABT8SNX3_9CAUL|nr:hypothetical protein [Caulobacteraceae bacterium XZ-24]
MRARMCFAVLALALAACEDSPPEDAASPQTAPMTVPASMPKENSAAGAPQEMNMRPAFLGALTPADMQSLPAVEGCTFRRGEAALVHLVSGNGLGRPPGDGVARVNGALVHLSGVPVEVSDIARNDRYQAGPAVIEIRLAPDLGPSRSVGEGALSRPARLAIMVADEGETLDGELVCAS